MTFVVNYFVNNTQAISLMSIVDKHTQVVRTHALRLGFDYVGIAEAHKLEADARRLEAWLSKNYHGKMAYMANHFDKRVDPRLLVPGAQSVITLLCNYFPEESPQQTSYKIAKYAYGQDYHDVIRAKLKDLLQSMQEEIGEIEGRGFVDSAPVLERAWAVKSGLGWIGKNGNLIHKQQGSFFFIATLIVDLKLTPDLPYINDYCGTCTRCIDACPTEAILPDKTIRGDQCISYYTIELKEMLSDTDQRWDDWIFGCDICQDVCPWNRFSQAHQQEAFKPLHNILSYTKNDWEALQESEFAYQFKHSPIKRAGYHRLMNRIQHVKKQ